MAPRCTLCNHPKRAEIDRLLLDGSDTLRNIAKRYGTSPATLIRHREHLPKAMAKAQEAQEISLADDLLGQVKALRNKAIRILAKAEQAGDYRTALQGIREARACVELLLEVEGEIERGTVNIIVSPQWTQIRAVLIQALQHHPEARQSVATALQSIEGATGHDRAA